MKYKFYINIHKGATFFYILSLLYIYNAFDNILGLVYLGLHGSYGFFWVLKSKIFPDKTWEIKVPLYYGFVIWFGLSLYWIAPWIIISEVFYSVDEISNINLIILSSIFLYVFGVFLHFTSDMQKFTQLKYNKRQLINDGLFKKCRNINYFGELFYSQKINLLNKVDTNILPGLSKVQKPFLKESYKDNLPNIANSNIRQLNAEEGDITFNGRFGQSIRFGSNVKEIKTDDSTVPNTGKLNSPNIIIRAGQGVIESIPKKPVKEDINLDGSSIWMTTDQKVDIKLDNSHSTFIWADKGPEGFGGNRVTINSDGLIFNSKKNNILMSSMGFIGFTANTEIGLEVPNDTGRVYLGDGMADQPVLGGDQTMELFGLLIDYLLEFSNGLAPSMGSIINFPVPIPHIPISCANLITKLQTLKTRMNEPKSKTVHVGHLRGPE